MAEVKWIKIVTNVFDDEKILLIESMPEADSIIVIWFKILCLAGKQNKDGFLMLNDKIAYTEEMLATVFRKPLNVVRLAIKTFEAFNMIEVSNGIITITNWEKHQNIDRLTELREYNRIAQQKTRAKRKLLKNVNDVSMTSQSSHDTDIDIDKDIDKEKEVVVDNKATTTAFSSESLEVFKHAQKCNFILSAIDREKLTADIEIYSKEEVIKALEIANDRGKRSYGYFKGILQSRRAGDKDKSAKEEEFEKAKQAFLEDDSI